MPFLYVAVYLARAPQQEPFPFDDGDDPSFRSARELGGPVTWGVCRPDVRSALRRGDWVAFFAAQTSLDRQRTVYRFAATLEVEEKLNYWDVFSGNGRFSEYRNLLMRPFGEGWEHYEPALPSSQWHKDWLWRVCRSPRIQKGEVLAASEGHIPGNPLMLRGHPITIPNNYVVFSDRSKLVLVHPPVVAVHEKGQPQEVWADDVMSRRIRQLVFQGSSRGLRTSHPQQPHRHFRRTLDDPSWPDALRRILSGTPVL